jgi:2-aminoadipate transaminase
LTEFSNYRNLPIVEDNPYGDLWFDEPPAASLTSRNPQGCIYLGSFSKILAPGLRLGYMVAPKALYPKLLQAKQAADLHSPSFNQRVAHQVMQNGFLDRHVPLIRTLYKSKRDAMLRALQNNFPNANSGSDDEMSWTTPSGGMFLWVRLPKGMNSVGLLPNAVAEGVAFVPGSPFYAEHPDDRTMRLSFVTASDDDIEAGISKLAKLIC